MDHPLHIAVAKAIQKSLKGSCELLKDPACGGTQNLPLFVGAVRGRDTWMCNADLLIITDNQVGVIVEIEESGFLPTKICGKFLQSDIATYFIHDLNPKRAVPYGNHVLFVQVLDGTKFTKKNSKKYAQCEMIERQINAILPIKNASITEYRLLFINDNKDKSDLHSIGSYIAQFLH